MHICQTGKISDNFYMLGHAAVPIYLLDGPEPLLFDAGFSGLSYLYVKEIKAVLGNRPPAFLFLTHAHWDHVGAAAYFKKIWPHMKIAGSLKSSQILARKGAIAQIKALNQNGLEALRSWGVSHIYEGDFRHFTFDIVLKGGREMNIRKGLTLNVIAAPGHTWDFNGLLSRRAKDPDFRGGPPDVTASAIFWSTTRSMARASDIWPS